MLQISSKQESYHAVYACEKCTVTVRYIGISSNKIILILCQEKVMKERTTKSRGNAPLCYPFKLITVITSFKDCKNELRRINYQVLFSHNMHFMFFEAVYKWDNNNLMMLVYSQYIEKNISAVFLTMVSSWNNYIECKHNNYCLSAIKIVCLPFHTICRQLHKSIYSSSCTGWSVNNKSVLTSCMKKILIFENNICIRSHGSTIHKY